MDLESRYNEIAQRVFAELASLGLPPIPEYYVVWFRHLEGGNPALTDAINERISGNLQITTHFLRSLFNQYCREDDQSEKELSAALTSIENEASGLQGLAHAMVSLTGTFGAEVESANRSLAAGSVDADEVKKLVNVLVEATNETVKRNSALNEKLASAVDEVTEIRAFLTRVAEQTRTDFLTKLCNRRQFESVLGGEIQNSNEKNKPLCLILCNIDHFKKFNYDFGYKVGDQAIVLVANTIKENVKGRDVVARYTGEEFAIMLPDTSLSAATSLAEKLRESIAKRKLVTRSTQKHLGTINMSFGIADYRYGDARDALIETAYARLYEAKKSGRSKVVATLTKAQACA